MSIFRDEIRSILRENPFSPSYNLEKIIKESKNNNLTKVESDLIKFLLSCHSLYFDGVKNILRVFDELNLSKKDLIDFFFIGTNKQLINSRNIYLKQFSEKSKSDSTGVDIESLSFERFETGYGNEISAKEAFERGGDVLNIFISFVNEREDKKIDFNEIDNLENQFLFDCFAQIWIQISQMYSFNSFYDILRYEDGYVEINEDETIIKIKCSDKYKEIRTIKKVGEIRESSYVNEYLSYLVFTEVETKKEKVIVSYENREGLIIPIVGVKKGKIDFTLYAKYLASSGYLENERFEYYDIELFEIYKIISVIDNLMTLINNDCLKIEIDNSLKNIPYKVNKSLLINVISECTNIIESSVEKIIDALTDTSSMPYFWRKPLYIVGDYLYLSLALLSAPNHKLLLETVINKIEVDEEKQLKRFKNFIVDEISNADCKYQFEVVEVNDNDVFNDSILVELENFYLLINLFMFREHPIESYETEQYINKLDAISKNIINKTQNIVGLLELNKPTTSIIVGNSKYFSGLNFNKIPVLDFSLLKNYFVTGEFKKVRMIFEKGSSTPRVYNKITYYNDENEFNQNLLGFLNYPIPIHQRVSKIIWKEQSVFPDGTKPKLYIDNYDFTDKEDLLERKIYALERSLNYQFYNNTKDREDEIFNEHIHFYLADIFNLLAFGKYDLSVYRYRISETFQKSRIHGFFHLINYFTIATEKLSHIKLKKDKKFKPVSYDEDATLILFDKIFSNKKGIRLFDFTIDQSLNKTEEKQLISLALGYLSTLTTRKYNVDEMHNFLFFLCVIRAFKKKYNLDNEFYLSCSNLISAINFDNRYQQARNFSEEILLIALEDRKAYRGWGILFLCLEQQRNVFDSTIYGCLYITSLSVETKLSYSEFVDVFYSILKFARDKPAYHLLDGVFNLLKSIKLKEYDRQKVHLSYYLSIANTRKENLNEVVDESITFYRENSKKILKYKENGVFPWLNYFYNLIRFRDEGVITSEIQIDDIIEELEKNISNESKEFLQKMHFAKDGVKEGFIKSLKNVLLTYSYQDFIYEIQNLEIIANHLIQTGIDNNDFGSILLSGFVFNDITLTYNNKYIEKETKVRFNLKNDVGYEYLNNYSDYIKDKIDIKKGRLLLYLFSFKNTVYSLIINDKKEMEIIELSEWNLSIMNKWLKQKNKFYFDSKNYFDLREQEDSYEKTISQLAFTEINLNYDFEELLIATNLNLSKFPLNLVINQGDFLASKKIISNILSIEWFIENDKELILNENYSSTSWIPIQDADPDINFAYDKLKPVCNKYDIKIIKESLPKKVIDTDVNIFLAHGELNQLGFKAIYKSDGINSAVIENKQLIGKGEVAVLFICNSGVINEDLFSNSVISLVYEIILSGYKTVIAPCWSLETSIPSFWLDEFLDSFNSGDYISESVFKANNKLAEYKEEISNAFYVPQGRLAMHLYGNPNIRVSKKGL